MRILYATDGSEGGLSPAHFFSCLPHHRDVHVHIVTVLDPDDPDDGAALLAAAQAALGTFPGHVTTATGRGASTSEVVDVLLYTADYAQADLIAVGAGGRSAIARFFLGSVAESVARHSRHPVLITRSRPDSQTTPLREVIVGVDGSEKARAAALFAATRLPLPLVCTLRLVSVVPQPLFGAEGDPRYPGTPDYQALESSNRAARRKAESEAQTLAVELREAVAALEAGQGADRALPSVVVEPVVLGNAAVELVRVADESSAGLVVVGSQGLSGIERFLLGSVSQRVLRHARTSVLIHK
jgi:nucleotide-binding universal stress UspA family protein